MASLVRLVAGDTPATACGFVETGTMREDRLKTGEGALADLDGLVVAGEAKRGTGFALEFWVFRGMGLVATEAGAWMALHVVRGTDGSVLGVDFFVAGEAETGGRSAQQALV